jgi:hypothetical protein
MYLCISFPQKYEKVRQKKEKKKNQERSIVEVQKREHLVDTNIYLRTYRLII